MERNLVTERELLSLLNKELQKYNECTTCQFISVFKLVEYDETGCNWSTPSIISCGVPIEIYKHIVDRIVFEAMTKYNIK
jgi:hypothetical protein